MKFRKALQWVALAILVIAATAGILYAVLDDKTPAQTYATTDLRAGGQTIRLDIADTAEKQQLGLGKRASLAADRGMVFPYPGEAERCFWMKDMRFAIDMIWLDAGKQIVAIEAGVQPDTYPRTFCHGPARYVVELSDGRSRQLGLQAGQRLDIGRL